MNPEQRAEIERRDRSAVHGDDDSPECMQAVSDRHVLLEALVMAEQRANAYHDALADAHRETAEQAAEIVPIVDRVLTSSEAHERLQLWVERHFGDTAPGAATARFHAAVEQLIAEWRRAAAEHADDPVTSESNPFDEDIDEDAAPGEG